MEMMLGSWDSGLTLALDEVLKSNVSVYMNTDSKTIEINHDLRSKFICKIIYYFRLECNGGKKCEQNSNIKR